MISKELNEHDARDSRYESRSGKCGKRTLAWQKDKLKAARAESISGAFADAGSPMTGYGFGIMVSSPPKIPSYVKSGWHDLGSWFTPNGGSAPLMPDAKRFIMAGFMEAIQQESETTPGQT